MTNTARPPRPAFSLNPTLMDKYLFKQLIDYFVLGLVVFTLIAFFSDTVLKLIRDIQQYGIPFTTLLTLVGLQLPRSIALVLPASSFVAALMVYNQLNNNFEIISMRTAGISLWRLMAPALALGMACTAMSYVLTDYVVPYANRQSEIIKREIIQQGVLPASGESFMKPVYDQNHSLLQMIYISTYEGAKLGDSTYIDLSKPNVMQVVQAKSGYWNMEKGWRFDNANIYLVSSDAEHSSAGHSEQFVVKNLLKRGKEAEKIREDYRDKESGLAIDSSEQSFMELWQVINKRQELGMRVSKGSRLNMWEKLTMPLASFIIILSAVPLALTPPRSGSNRGFVFSIVVLFLFYILHSVFSGLGKVEIPFLLNIIGWDGYIALVSWLPIAIMAGIGILLIRRKTYVL